jgi:hypothetical protein
VLRGQDRSTRNIPKVALCKKDPYSCDSYSSNQGCRGLRFSHRKEGKDVGRDVRAAGSLFPRRLLPENDMAFPRRWTRELQVQNYLFLLHGNNRNYSARVCYRTQTPCHDEFILKLDGLSLKERYTLCRLKCAGKSAAEMLPKPPTTRNASSGEYTNIVSPANSSYERTRLLRYAQDIFNENGVTRI